MLTKLKYLNRIFDNNYSQTLPSRRSHSDKLTKKNLYNMGNRYNTP